jgi:hypothetical protein
VDVVEAEEVLDALGSVVGGSHAMRPAAWRPRHPADGPHFERSPLVEADDRRARGARPVERTDGVFFTSNAGSCDVFQVRIR